MIGKLGTVIGGSPVWRGKTGQVLVEEGDMVVLLLTARDSGDNVRCYEVRMPARCVKLIDAPADPTALN